MKRKDQIIYILNKVWETNQINKAKLLLYCSDSGIVDESTFEQLLSYLEKKGYIAVKDDFVITKITKNDFSKLSITDRAFTFVNGGSRDKMVYNPPNTSFTSR